MNIEKTYNLYQIEISYGKRTLIYNSNQWRVSYFYKGKIIDNKNLDVAKYWKVLHKYHSNKLHPELVAPQITTIKESR